MLEAPVAGPYSLGRRRTWNMGTMLKILIVEDEVILAVELEHVLQEIGHRVVGHAVASRDAVELAAREAPDLALIDVHLFDGPTGADAARIMTRDFKTAVLFMTANPTRIPEDFALACGVVTKPYTDQGLRSVVGFLEECLKDGRATRRTPASLTLSPEYKQRWGAAA